MGAQRYTLFDKIKKIQPNTCIVEVGSQRGEGSTDYFIDLSEKLGCPFYTVDVDYDVYIWIAHKCHAFLMSGEEFVERVLPNMGLKAGIVYMDGFDWIWKGMDDRDFIIAQKATYNKLGMELGNEASQESHLRISRALVDFNQVAKGGLILFDDTWCTGADYDGKGGKAVPHLLSNGYEVVEQSPVAEEDNKGYVLLRRV